MDISKGNLIDWVRCRPRSQGARGLRHITYAGDPVKIITNIGKEKAAPKSAYESSCTNEIMKLLL